MSQVNESICEFRDGVSVGGKRLHHTFKPMTNTELILDQLQTINGGAAFMKLGDIKGECRQIVHPEFKTGFHTPFGTARSKESFGSFEPREVKSVEIGRPPDPKLWLQLLK